MDIRTSNSFTNNGPAVWSGNAKPREVPPLQDGAHFDLDRVDWGKTAVHTAAGFGKGLAPGFNLVFPPLQNSDSVFESTGSGPAKILTQMVGIAGAGASTLGLLGLLHDYPRAVPLIIGGAGVVALSTGVTSVLEQARTRKVANPDRFFYDGPSSMRWEST